MSARLPLFVYGTLLDGEAQAPLLVGLGRRRASVRGQLFRMPAGYPALVPSGEGWVHGELVDPPSDRVLALLDTYEGVDEGLYERVVCDVRAGLRTETAWVYVMEAARARTGHRIPDGRWRSTRRG